MRKQLFCILLFALALALTACNKNRTCTCIADNETHISEMIYVTKAKAEDYCANQESQYQQRDVRATCTLD